MKFLGPDFSLVSSSPCGHLWCEPVDKWIDLSPSLSYLPLSPLSVTVTQYFLKKKL